MTLMSCKGNKDQHFRPYFAPKSIDILKATYNGNPLILSKTNLLEFYGQPSSEIKNCVTISNLTSNQNIQYDCWTYQQISRFGFDIYKNIGYLSYVSFRNTATQINYPEIKFSSQTTLNDIKRQFPKTYNLKILGNEDGLIIVSLNDNLMTQEHESANIIELGFKNGFLDYYKYQIEPEYWSNFQFPK